MSDCSPDGRNFIDEDDAWALTRAVRAKVGASARSTGVEIGYHEIATGAHNSSDQPPLLCASGGDWQAAQPTTRQAAAIFDLYLPLCWCGPDGTLTVGHLGQSLDGQIAAADGDSFYVTGEANIIHLHRMRALFDAVVVGAGTVRADNPRLTTRRVDGPSPTRVVIDPGRTLPDDCCIFHDRAAPSIVVCAAGGKGREGAPGFAELLVIETDPADLAPKSILAALHRRGLRRVFVEGGGRTVSRFMREGVLDRLHLAIAPVIVGDGRPGLRVSGIETMADAIRPQARQFRMGEDVLFDCDLRT